ncbi:MAG: class III extradiol dioxygenase subunit B-like domain-containing protein [bacterium]
MLVFSAIMPHPPMSIAGIGSAQDFNLLSQTMKSFEKLRSCLEKSDPDTIVVISPHAHLEKYAFVVNSSEDLIGSLNNFGLDGKHVFKNNLEIVDMLDYACMANEMPCLLCEEELDHGALVPLLHLTKNIKPKIVHLSFSLMDYKNHYLYGQIIQGVLDLSGAGRVAVIASGDLSHKLSKNSPAGYSSIAKDFDRDVLHFLGSGDLVSLMGMENETIKKAAECGLRSIIILLGILHEKKYKFELLSYEAPFGIGYLTAKLL